MFGTTAGTANTSMYLFNRADSTELLTMPILEPVKLHPTYVLLSILLDDIALWKLHILRFNHQNEHPLMSSLKKINLRYTRLRIQAFG